VTAPSTATPWTVARLLTWTTGYLKEHGSESPRLDAEVLLAHARGCPRIDLYVQFDTVVDEAVRTRFRELVRKRAEAEPVAYLVGRKEFFSLELEVNPAVLIPRPDSEFVVLQFLDLTSATDSLEVADVGTGSGNIAVAAAKHRPAAHFTATDVSAEALEVARRNARRHDVADRIAFHQRDLLSDLPAGEQFDFILSNPPYIATEELPMLPPGVRDYEPAVALDGGPGGTRVVDRLIAQAVDRLRPGGFLILEIGAEQHEPVRRLIDDAGAFDAPTLQRDYAGHPRVLASRRRAT
jgi:release factor glutamine methyltransferase